MGDLFRIECHIQDKNCWKGTLEKETAKIDAGRTCYPVFQSEKEILKGLF